MGLEHESSVPSADDAETYDPGDGAPERLERLARLLRQGCAPPYALIVLAPDDILVDVETDIMPEAQDMLLALTVVVDRLQAAADEWAMVSEMSEASAPRDDKEER
jgi:hypothetical protein